MLTNEKQKLVTDNIDLISRYQSRKRCSDDYVDLAQLSLVEAADIFNEKSKLSFRNFARQYMFRRLQDYLRKSNMFYVSRYKFKKLKQKDEDVEKRFKEEGVKENVHFALNQSIKEEHLIKDSHLLEEMANKEKIQEVLDFVGEIHSFDRIIFINYFINEIPMKVIGRCIGRSEAAIHKRLKKIMSRIEDHYNTKIVVSRKNDRKPCRLAYKLNKDTDHIELEGIK